ncbi:MAG: hypothetical protein H0T04_04925 [Chloroflexi bacterium]|nr:hypothetical protein [Chloroflexota bacterium]MDQ3407469.1 hypothetical protein [Chloroflexota bacterium]
MLIFGLVCGFLTVWTLQAVHAYRRAVEGRTPDDGSGTLRTNDAMADVPTGDGASRLMLIAPVAIVSITLVFLVGGRVATPGATVERYVHAWIDGDASAAASMFAEPLSEEEMARVWAADGQRLAKRLAAMAPPPGSAPAPGSARAPEGRSPVPGLDLTAVRFEYPPQALADASTAQIDIWIVETVLVRSTVLGIFPASLRETRVLARAGRATLHRERVGPALPFLPAAGVWRLERVEID